VNFWAGKAVDDITYSLTGGDLEDLGRETNGALNTELLILGTVDQVRRDYTVSSIHE
jgi:hypothetical protein